MTSCMLPLSSKNRSSTMFCCDGITPSAALADARYSAICSAAEREMPTSVTSHAIASSNMIGATRSEPPAGAGGSSLSQTLPSNPPLPHGGSSLGQTLPSNPPLPQGGSSLSQTLPSNPPLPQGVLTCTRFATSSRSRDTDAESSCVRAGASPSQNG